ncbi:MAG: hypothetical protein WC002_07570, partial [Candidatus Muiribacteriota bacterium]
MVVKKGFTVAEIVITMALVTIIVGPLLTSFIVGLRSTQATETDFNMDMLGQELLQEIMNRHYEDPVHYGSIGREANENERKDFNDVDDYLGYAEDFGQIKDLSGNTLLQYENYKRFVEIFNEEGNVLSAEDGLKFEEEQLISFPRKSGSLKISRDGTRIFGVDYESNSVFAGLPFADEIEAVYSFVEPVLNIEISPDSKIIYANLGDKIEMLSYTPGQFVQSGVVEGVDFGEIRAVNLVGGNIAIATDRGLFIDSVKIGNYTDVHFIYVNMGKLVLGADGKIIIADYNNPETVIDEKEYDSTMTTSITSAYFDSFNNIIYVTTAGMYVHAYYCDESVTNKWVHLATEDIRELNTIVYSHINGEFLAGGEENLSQGIKITNKGDLTAWNEVFAESNLLIKKIEMSHYSPEAIILGENGVHTFNIATA